ncbi:MAG TPA: HAMP domain-containing sensor histidine kinase [Ktedonobacterales bacterium]
MEIQRDEQHLMSDEENSFVRFLDIAGHDLRNPITVLKSQVQLLQRRLGREGGRDDDLRDLGRMAYQIERLNVGLDTFLEAARIAQGRFSLILEMCDLCAVSRRLAAIYGSASRAHTVMFELPDDPIIASWDTARVELALAALLANALKFSTQGEIRVKVTREPSFARVSVTDTGVGVPRGEEATIFEPYISGSNIENPGVGLGLYVAREIVREHGGDIGVISVEDGGTTFWFTLPLAGAVNGEAFS